ASDQVSTFLLVALDQWVGFTFADGAQAVAVDAFADQVFTHGVGAALRQGRVVFLGTQAVGVAGDFDVGDRGGGLQGIGDLVQLRRWGDHDSLVEGEQLGRFEGDFLEAWRRWWWRCDWFRCRRRRLDHWSRRWCRWCWWRVERVVQADGQHFVVAALEAEFFV